MNYIKNLITISLSAIILLPSVLQAQKQIEIHSHNDYRQRVPFYQAYSQGVSSIEADLFYVDGQLLIGHDPEDLNGDRRFESLYIDPILKLYSENNGKAWKDSDNILTLLVEIKSETSPTLAKIVELLDKYPRIFDPKVNPYAVRIVITGNVPKPAEFGKYPDYIGFDGLIDENYTPQQLARVPMISLPFFDYASWNGKGSLTASQKEKVQGAIDQVHKMGKPIRFWAAPDGVTAWNTLYYMGVDIINTDKVELCADYFRNFVDKNFFIDGSKHNEMKGVKGTDRLDKTTSGFKGFDRDKIQLTQRIETYKPTYLNNGVNKPVKNVILLIGDGMGLNQVNIAETVNKGLTLLNFLNIGFQINSPLDCYTSDSASGGSALATGKRHYNRHIAMSETGEIYPSITDFASEKGIACGVVTLGNLADATPAAFYGHSTERDNADEITRYLLDGKLTVLAGGGLDVFTKRDDGIDMVKELKKKYRFITDVEDIDKNKTPVICADNLMDLAATQQTIGLLADATRKSIDVLTQNSDNGFFLMVEGAKIDYAGHSNSLAGSVVEMLSFDLAIAEALKFADSNGETLVVVTADHETGGLVLVDGDREKGLITARYTTDDHTPVMLPVWAYGPGAQNFMGVYWNNEICNKITALLGIKK